MRESCQGARSPNGRFLKATHFFLIVKLYEDYTNLIAAFLIFSSCSRGASNLPSQRQRQELPAVMTVNSDPDEPAVPIDLSLTVQLVGRERRLVIAGQVKKNPGYPAAAFSEKDVRAEIVLPPGLQLSSGDRTWQGDLKGHEVGQWEAQVKPVQDGQWSVEAKAVGSAEGGRVDADTEQFYVLVQGDTMRLSLTPFRGVPPGPPPPGQSEKSKPPHRGGLSSN